jgi:hypothetical protein
MPFCRQYFFASLVMGVHGKTGIVCRERSWKSRFFLDDPNCWQCHQNRHQSPLYAIELMMMMIRRYVSTLTLLIEKLSAKIRRFRLRSLHATHAFTCTPISKDAKNQKSLLLKEKLSPKFDVFSFLLRTRGTPSLAALDPKMQTIIVYKTAKCIWNAKQCRISIADQDFFFANWDLIRQWNTVFQLQLWISLQLGSQESI